MQVASSGSEYWTVKPIKGCIYRFIRAQDQLCIIEVRYVTQQQEAVPCLSAFFVLSYDAERLMLNKTGSLRNNM